MTRLLVSVRDAREAAAALRGGADLIDIKEPRHGSLGAAEPRTWQAVRQAVGPRVPLSVALGEWHDEQTPLQSDALAGFAFAKVGLAGATSHPQWRDAWAGIVRRITASSAAVAVAYADWHRAAAPPPLDVVQLGAQLGCTVALCDTWRKDRPLSAWLDAGLLRDWCACARDCHMQVALAGSVERKHLGSLLELEPDWIAVRGAACVGGRDGSVNESLVSLLSREVKTAVGKSLHPAALRDEHS